jgi:DNA-binding beta-propeller fold protein YncE
MRKHWLCIALALCPLCPWGGQMLCSAPEPRPEERHRSPADVAVLPGGRLALTANHTSDSASLIDLVAGNVLAEQPCGHRPAAVASSPDGRRAAVSNFWDGTLSLLEVRGPVLVPAGTVSVGSQPRGLAFAPDGGSLYAALAGTHEVVHIDWRTHNVLRRWPAPAEPRHLALTRDGRFLAAVSSRSAQVRCWDTQTGKQLWERTVVDAFNLHGLVFSPDDKELVTAHVHDRRRPIAVHNIEQGWALDSRLSRLTLEPERHAEYRQIALDTRGQAVGDPCAVAFSARGDQLAVAAAGTHELLLFQAAALPWTGGDPGDFIDSGLEIDEGKYRRVPLGGRPLAVQFVEASDQAVVANYLLDAVQIVDTQTGKLVRQIPLGGPSLPSLTRRGEAIFYDARRSHHQWFSCHTCHPDGHTNGRSFDTLNDESYGNPKLTPTLRGTSRTGPWTWHGWQQDLSQAIEKSLTETLFGPKPSADDIRAVLAFLGTLDHPPTPHRGPEGLLGEAAERGRAIFQGKGRCARCHQGEHYTSAKNYDVKLEEDDSPFTLWNPPSLRGVSERGPYLHDGRAETLEELLRSAHAPEKLGAEVLTAEERRNLIEFLKSL